MSGQGVAGGRVWPGCGRGSCLARVWQGVVSGQAEGVLSSK